MRGRQSEEKVKGSACVCARVFVCADTGRQLRCRHAVLPPRGAAATRLDVVDERPAQALRGGAVEEGRLGAVALLQEAGPRRGGGGGRGMERGRGGI